MERKTLLKRTAKSMEKLSDMKLREVSDYVEFLVKRSENSQLNHEIASTASQSQAFSFLEDEEDVYADSDLKETYL